MAVRITEAQTAQVRDDAYVLVTQKETVNGAETEVLRRVAMGDVNKQIEESEWASDIRREVNGVSIALNTNVQKRLRNLEAAAAGKLYIDDVDDTVAYTKAVDGNVLPYASIDKVGGRSLVWNQYARPTQGASIRDVNINVAADGKLTSSGTSTGPGGRLNFVQEGVHLIDGHKYFVVNPLYPLHLFFSEIPTGTVIMSSQVQGYDIIVPTREGICGVGFNCLEGMTYSASGYLRIHDLTAMFGAGNEPDADTFAKMFPSDYYPYSEPTLMNFGVNRIVSRGRNLAYMENGRTKRVRVLPLHASGTRSA